MMMTIIYCITDKAACIPWALKPRPKTEALHRKTLALKPNLKGVQRTQ